MKKQHPDWKPGDNKLSDNDVRAIRKDPRKYRDISDQYGVSVSVVCTIKTGLSHRRIPNEV